MEASFLAFLARVAGITFTATGRPALTFALVQLGLLALARLGAVQLDPQLAWLFGLPAIGVALVLAVLEHVVLADGDLDAFVRRLRLDRVGAGVGALATTLLLVAAGAVAPVDLDATTTATPLPAVATATAAAAVSSTGLEQLAELRHLVPTLAVTIVWGQLLAMLRHWVLVQLEQLALDAVYRRLELGGAPAVLLLVALAPVLLVVLLVVSTAALAAAALGGAWLSKARDAARRRPCPGCGQSVRVEASRCAHCKTELTPTELLRA